MRLEKHRYIVETHCGTYETYATSARKAINNIRYRIFGNVPNDSVSIYWTAKQAVA